MLGSTLANRFRSINRLKLLQVRSLFVKYNAKIAFFVYKQVNELNTMKDIELNYFVQSVSKVLSLWLFCTITFGTGLSDFQVYIVLESQVANPVPNLFKYFKI